MEQNSFANFRDGFNLSFAHLKNLIAVSDEVNQFNLPEKFPVVLKQAKEFVEGLQKQVEEREKFRCHNCNYVGLANELVITHPVGEEHFNEFNCPKCQSQDVEIMEEASDPEIINLYQCRNALQDLVRLKQSKEMEGKTEEYETMRDTLWINAHRLLEEAKAIEAQEDEATTQSPT